jgi:hypothetical protein
MKLFRWTLSIILVKFTIIGGFESWICLNHQLLRKGNDIIQFSPLDIGCSRSLGPVIMYYNRLKTAQIFLSPMEEASHVSYCDTVGV